MLEIIFAPAARQDLDEAARYLSARNAESAVRLLQKLDHALELLRGRPFMGPAVEAGRLPEIRKLTVPPYAIYYRVLSNQIEIARVIYHAQESERQKL